MPTSGARAHPIPRPAARVIVVDERGRVLLFRSALPNRDGSEPLSIWITPGGALEPGETHKQAARRELWEETGLTDATPGPCVWTRRHVFWWLGAWVEQIERCYLLRTPRFAIKPTRPDELEGEFLMEYRWWSVAEIAAAAGTETFAPRRLAELLEPIVDGWVPDAPIDVGI